MGRRVTLWNYLRVDLYRSVVSWRFLAGILGIAFTMYFASLEGIASDTNVNLYGLANRLWDAVYAEPGICGFPFLRLFLRGFLKINMLILRLREEV